MKKIPVLLLRIVIIVLVAGLTAASVAWSLKLYRDRVHTQRKVSYDEKIMPIVVKNHKRNQEAASRAIKSAENMIESYRAGVKPFVEDIMSYGTRKDLLWNTARDKIAGKHDAEDLIKGKFDEHLFSNAKLKKNLKDVFNGLRTDLQANQNQMLQEAHALAAANDISFNLSAMQAFGESVREELLRVAKEQSSDSVTSGVMTIIISGVAGMAADSLLTPILTPILTGVAFDMAATVGITVGGGTVGAEAGALAGPAGVAVGAAAGLIVGAAVDWWMSGSFKKKTEAEMNTQITHLRDALLNGSTKHKGLKELLTNASEGVSKAQSDQMEKIFFP